MNSNENTSHAIKCSNCGSAGTTGPKGTWKCTECGSRSNEAESSNSAENKKGFWERYRELRGSGGYWDAVYKQKMAEHYLSNLFEVYIVLPIIVFFGYILKAFIKVFIFIILIPFKVFIYPFRLLWRILKRNSGVDSKKNKELKAEDK
mgnify:CR=1 FL=1